MSSNRLAAMVMLFSMIAPTVHAGDSPFETACGGEYAGITPGERRLLDGLEKPGLDAFSSERRALTLVAPALRSLCAADATAHPDNPGLALAAGDLAEAAGDRADAMRWYREAAALGDPDAITLVYWVERNAGPPLEPVDQQAAVAEFAAADYIWAVQIAGDDYEFGKSVPADRDRALALYEHAAGLGLDQGTVDAARLHADKPEQAAIWWRRAMELAPDPDRRSFVLLHRAATLAEQEPAAALALVDEALATGADGPIRWIEGRSHSDRFKPLARLVEQRLVADGWLAAGADGVINRATVFALGAYQESIKGRPRLPIQDWPLNRRDE